MLRFSLLVLMLFSVISIPREGHSQEHSDSNMSEQLARFGGRHDLEGFIHFFKSGDRHIAEISAALQDKDPKVRANAQLVIRYLGNKDGMKALVESYRTGDNKLYIGVVPVPLSDWDYEQIEEHILCEGCRLQDPFVPEYVYALALDPSISAKQTLLRFQTKQGKDRVFIGTVTNLNSQTENHKELAKVVLKHSFFLSSIDKKNSRVRFLTFSDDKLKAILEIYVDNGILAEKWFHVVMIKEQGEWKFLSVSLTAVS